MKQQGELHDTPVLVYHSQHARRPDIHRVQILHARRCSAQSKAPFLLFLLPGILLMCLLQSAKYAFNRGFRSPQWHSEAYLGPGRNRVILDDNKTCLITTLCFNSRSVYQHYIFLRYLGKKENSKVKCLRSIYHGVEDFTKRLVRTKDYLCIHEMFSSKITKFHSALDNLTFTPLLSFAQVVFKWQNLPLKEILIFSSEIK